MYEQYTVAPKSNHSSVHSMSRNISLSHEMIGFLETRKPCLEIGKLQIRGVGARITIFPKSFRLRAAPNHRPSRFCSRSMNE